MRCLLSCRRDGPRGGGFTLNELLVVVAVIAPLISILLPSLARARDQAKAVVCSVRMKEMGNATATFLAESLKSNAQGSLGWGSRPCLTTFGSGTRFANRVGSRGSDSAGGVQCSA